MKKTFKHILCSIFNGGLFQYLCAVCLKGTLYLYAVSLMGDCICMEYV